MKTNHYGHTVDSDKPVTGVLSSNSIAWEWITDDVCLTCQDIQSEIESDESLTDEQKEHELEFMECDSAHTKIMGDWLQDEKGKYYPDESKDFAAIINETTVQVVWSKTITTGNLCSPCYPGQVDLDSKGIYKAYTLPDELLNHD